MSVLQNDDQITDHITDDVNMAHQGVFDVAA
jgi:hypothetical protein